MENFSAYQMVIGFSLMIILSYIYNSISKKTGIPSVLMLITTGALLRLYLKPDTNAIQPLLEILGIVGLIMIVLEAALDLHLSKEKNKLLLKAFVAALVMFALTAFPIALLFNFFFEVTFLKGLIYAVPLSIISSAIIIPSVGALREYLKEFLIVESAVSDILGIMVFYFLVDIQNMEAGRSIPFHIVSNIITTLFFAVILGYAVAFLLDKFTGEVKLFMPIATLILLYAIGKSFHLSSLIFVLAFGLIISNRKIFFKGKVSKLVREENMKRLVGDLKVVTLESSFVIRTFFFLLFGMSISFSDLKDVNVFIIGASVLAVMYGTRFLYLSIFERKNIFPTIAIAPRGLITVLLFYSIPTVLKIDGFQPGILLLAIIVTNTVMTYGLVKGRVEPAETTNTAEEKETDPPEVNAESAEVIDGIHSVEEVETIAITEKETNHDSETTETSPSPIIEVEAKVEKNTEEEENKDELYLYPEVEKEDKEDKK